MCLPMNSTIFHSQIKFLLKKYISVLSVPQFKEYICPENMIKIDKFNVGFVNIRLFTGYLSVQTVQNIDKTHHIRSIEWPSLVIRTTQGDT